MDQAVGIMRNRVDALGVSEPEIRKEAGNRITIALAGIKDKAQATRIIGSTAALVFTDLENSLTPGVSSSVAGGGAAAPKKSLYALLMAAKSLPREGRRPRSLLRLQHEDEARARPGRHPGGRARRGQREQDQARSGAARAAPA